MSLYEYKYENYQYYFKNIKSVKDKDVIDRNYMTKKIVCLI